MPDIAVLQMLPAEDNSANLDGTYAVAGSADNKCTVPTTQVVA